MHRLVPLALLAACAAPPAAIAPELLATHISASPTAVQTAAARVLAIHGFTLAPLDRATGVVQSQPMEVTRTWEGSAVTARVDCGKDMAGVEKAATNPVQVTLGFITSPDGQGTTLRLRPTVTTYDAVARNMASTNMVAGAQAGTTPCELKAPFVQSIMTEIVSAAASQ